MRCVIAGIVLALSLTSAPADTTISGIAHIVDGDTLNLGPVRIRLHGIDAPEAGQRCNDKDGGTWRCGDEATAALARLAGGERIECTALDVDRYGRIIATCRADGEEINSELIRTGLAWAFTQFSADYAELEAEVRESGVGIWRADTETPWDYRANRWNRAAAESPKPGCPIKGNISSKGERIYHTPWSPWYGRTKINEANGERWFCDEAEALAAGWRAARWN